MDNSAQTTFLTTSTGLFSIQHFDSTPKALYNSKLWNGYVSSNTSTFVGYIHNANLLNQVIPTSSLTGVTPNANNCCGLATWVGLSDNPGGLNSKLAQAGVWTSPNSFMSYAAALWYELGYVNQSMIFPSTPPGCPVSQGTIITSITAQPYVNDRATDKYTFTFNYSSGNCILTFTDTNGPYSTPYYVADIDEAVSWAGHCSYSGSICEIPNFAAHDLTSVFGTSLGSGYGYVSTFHDRLYQGCSYNIRDSGIVTPSPGNQYFTDTWQTSAQQGAGWQC
jgi:hypothetical protein